MINSNSNENIQIKTLSDYDYAFLLNSVKTEIQTDWILENINQLNNKPIIKQSLLNLIDFEYQSQQSSKIQTITNIINGQGDTKWLINQALQIPFSLGSSSLAEFVHCNTIFKACVEYEKTKDIEEKLNLIMITIDQKLSDSEFIRKFKNENPDIVKSIKAFALSKYKKNNVVTDIKIITKPKYIVWGITLSMFAGTCLGLFFYLKKK